ncbi:MAG: glycoside hydrolase family 10 protein, partial [Longimicrobiales bacterium]
MAKAASSSEPPPLAREFRGVWVATVGNMDWPSRAGLPVEQQKAELIHILETARRLNLNAVVFQVRPSGDAFYSSALEPWSEYLTGEMGRPPFPLYDPLEFAIDEAHKRGLELHAWFNPYRARYANARSVAAPSHISQTRPNLIRRYGPFLWMDPGEPAIREHALAVITDVVRRYDVDGIHIDDYFYPYQERTTSGRLIQFPDDASWNRYRRAGGDLSRDDWRRHNVNLFVEQLYARVKSLKPAVKVGISPFGIWRPGHPRSVTGLDAFTEIYADARKWLREGWVDYFVPQLYWRISAPSQSYPELLRWWVEQNEKGRHIWAGNAPYRVLADAQNWPVREIVDQIRLTRQEPGASGNVHFNMSAFLRNRGGLVDTLSAESYT